MTSGRILNIGILLTIIQSFFIGPVCSFFYIFKMWVLLTQSRIKNRHLHTRTCTLGRDYVRKHCYGLYIFFLTLEVEVTFLPVCPICQRTSAWRIWATWRGMARSSRRLECRPVACQKPEPSDRLVRLKGRDDCHDCHFWESGVPLQGAAGSGAVRTKGNQIKNNNKHRIDRIQ